MKSENLPPSLLDEPETLSSDLPPTKDIYPVQAPYSEALDFNPTPPPEDSHEPLDLCAGASKGLPLKGVIIQGPPTPPHHSPTQSTNSATSLAFARDVSIPTSSINNVPMDLNCDRDQFMDYSRMVGVIIMYNLSIVNNLLYRQKICLCPILPLSPPRQKGGTATCP